MPAKHVCSILSVRPRVMWRKLRSSASHAYCNHDLLWNPGFQNVPQLPISTWWFTFHFQTSCTVEYNMFEQRWWKHILYCFFWLFFIFIIQCYIFISYICVVLFSYLYFSVNNHTNSRQFQFLMLMNYKISHTVLWQNIEKNDYKNNAHVTFSWKWVFSSN